MPFGMGFGELVLIVMIVAVAVFGSRRSLGPIIRGEQETNPREIRLIRARGSERWTTKDWLFVVVAVGLGIAAAVSVMARHPHPAQ